MPLKQLVDQAIKTYRIHNGTRTDVLELQNTTEENLPKAILVLENKPDLGTTLTKNLVDILLHATKVLEKAEKPESTREAKEAITLLKESGLSIIQGGIFKSLFTTPNPELISEYNSFIKLTLNFIDELAARPIASETKSEVKKVQAPSTPKPVKTPKSTGSFVVIKPKLSVNEAKTITEEQTSVLKIPIAIPAIVTATTPKEQKLSHTELEMKKQIASLEFDLTEAKKLITEAKRSEDEAKRIAETFKKSEDEFKQQVIALAAELKNSNTEKELLQAKNTLTIIADVDEEIFSHMMSCMTAETELDKNYAAISHNFYAWPAEKVAEIQKIHIILSTIFTRLIANETSREEEKIEMPTSDLRVQLEKLSSQYELQSRSMPSRSPMGIPISIFAHFNEFSASNTSEKNFYLSAKKILEYLEQDKLSKLKSITKHDLEMYKKFKAYLVKQTQTTSLVASKAARVPFYGL